MGARRIGSRPRRWLGALLLLALAGCGGRSPPGELRIEISHLAGGAPLALGDATYRTAAGDRFSVTALRYYLSNFRLHRPDGGWYALPRDDASDAGYFLVDEADARSRTFALEPVADGDYDGIEFLVGVDEARDHAGAQKGALDPARGMFWTWKSGYIFFLLEGRSPQSPEADQGLKFHVGGGEPSTARRLYLPLPAIAKVAPQLAPEVHLHADLAELFGGAAPIRFAALHAAMGGPEATRLADRLPGVFRVDHVHNEPRAPRDS